MVSSPTFDVNSKPDVEGDTTDKYTGVYLNRFLSSSYPPGSTFKLVTAAAALESQKDMDTRTYTCKRGVEVDGEWTAVSETMGKSDSRMRWPSPVTRILPSWPSLWGRIR